MQVYRITEAIVPVRKEMSHRSEMVNELLYGELILIKEQYDGWLEINCHEYDYSGFIPAITSMHEASGDLNKPFKFVYTASGIILQGDGNKLDLPRGARVTTEKTDSGCFKAFDPIESMEDVIKTAKFYLGNPYRWGGRSPFGIDCSGFTQMVCMLNGITIPRDAGQQVAHGNEVAFVSEARAGDLAFFQNENGQVVHTGIMLSSNEIIHASGRVRIDTIDHHGIFNRELNRYSHVLKVIRRLSLK